MENLESRNFEDYEFRNKLGRGAYKILREATHKTN